MQKKSVTREQAEEVLQRVKATWDMGYEWTRREPKLVEDWDGRKWVIIWEEGPEEWAYWTSQYNTAHVWTEPVNSAVLAIYSLKPSTHAQARTLLPLKPNKLYDLSDAERQVVINLLEGELAETGEEDRLPHVGIALEIVLEALGAEGYEFT